MFALPSEFGPSQCHVAPTERGIWFVFRGRELLLRDDGTLPRHTSPAALGLSPVRVQLLGALSGEPCFSAELARDVQLDGRFVLCDLRRAVGRLSNDLVALAGRAFQVMDWDRTHQFCGACGAPTRADPRQHRRVCTREGCGLQLFPRIAPAMIVAVERGPEVLLARSPHFPEGVYSTLAGFVDPGESLEHTVVREVLEEVGIRVKNLRYFGSQAWPFPHTLMLGFFADYEGGELRPDPEEIEHAAFFHVDALPKLFPGLLSVGNQLLAEFCRKHGRGFPV